MGMGLLMATLIPFVLTACSGNSEIRAEINDVKASAIDARRNHEATSKKLDVLEGALGAIDARLKEYPDKDTLDALRDSQTGLLEKVNGLLREFQVLSGRFDENKYLLDKSMKQASADLELIRSKVDSTDANAGSGVLQDLKSRLDAMEAELAMIKGKVTIYDEVLKQPAAEMVANAPAGGPVQAGQDPKIRYYDEALKAYNEKKYADARGLLKEFIKAAPDHKMVSNARFWIGETFYADNAFDDAILAYEEVIQRSPDSVKVPDSMLKQAYAFMQLGDKKAARGILGALIEKFPKHKLADTARKKLDAIK